MNSLNVSDDDAEAIVDAYTFLLFAIADQKLPIPEVLKEIQEVLSRHSEPLAQEARTNLQRNEHLFTQLFAATPAESISTKLHFLSSEVYNSVVAVRTICDARPVFDPKREHIVRWLYPTQVEFTVTDSTGAARIIALSLDEPALAALSEAIRLAEAKREKIMRDVGTRVEVQEGQA